MQADLVEKIVELVKTGTLTGVADVRDETDRTGLRVVIEPMRGMLPAVLLNQLFQHTRLQARAHAWLWLLAARTVPHAARRGAAAPVSPAHPPEGAHACLW